MSRVSRSLGRLGALVVLTLSWSCGSKPEPPKEKDLGGAAVANVGSQVIATYHVASVAKGQGVSPAQALDLAIEDALFAEAALAKHMDRDIVTQSRLRAARARWAERQILFAAQVKGPPTKDEIAEARRVNWRAFDRPDAVRVVHAVVKPRSADDTQFARAGREQAENLRKVLLEATSEEDFLKRAASVPGPYEVQPEPIPPIASDGYTTEGEGGIMDLTFTKAAFAIEKVNDTSPVVETPFGFHVIRLVERVAPKRLSDAEISQAIGLEVVAARAARIRGALLASLRKARPVEVSLAAETEMQKVFGAEPSPTPSP